MTDKTKTWGEMTPEEKGALLLAQHDGKEIQAYGLRGLWISVSEPTWHECYYYRVKPEPKRETVMLSGRVYRNGETVMLSGRVYRNGAWVFGSACKGDMYRITFDTIDGEPVLSSIRMEKIS